MAAGLTNQIAAALAVEAQAVTGIIAVAATPVDTVPQTPFIFIGPPRLTQVPGSWESRLYRFTMHLLVGRTGSEDRDQVAVNDLMDLVLNAWRAGVTLGGLGISEIYGADTDKFYSVGGMDYQSVDFDVSVQVYSAQSYTA